jgi:hypothetical protein
LNGIGGHFGVGDSKLEPFSAVVGGGAPPFKCCDFLPKVFSDEAISGGGFGDVCGL